jgi:dienelactone hydrolase
MFVVSALAWIALAVPAPAGDWQSIPVPQFWEKQHGGTLEGDHNGYAWYRCFFKVPANWQGRDLTLSLGAIDDCDQSYFNGQLVGAMGKVKPYQTASSLLRRYKVAAKLAKPGKWNLIAVRVFDGGGAGGIWHGPIELGCGVGSMSLSGAWHFRADDDASFAKLPAKDLDAVAAAFIKQAGDDFGKAINFSPLAGTKLLDWDGNDFSPRMRAGIHKFLDRKTAESVERRKDFWQRDISSPTAYEKSVARNRARFEQYIGAVDARKKGDWSMHGIGQAQPRDVAKTTKYTISEVQWPVLEPIADRSRGAAVKQNWPKLAGPSEVFSEGLLLKPNVDQPLGFVIVMGDADHTPEQLAGLAKGVPAESQMARRLAENGYIVIVPALLSRSNQFSKAARGNERTHRGWIYTPAFELGRHTIGYEVQKVRAAVDWVKRQSRDAKVAVAGYGEGGLLAMYSAAVDTRIDAAMVSGYFGPREAVWTEPLYRNVWGLLREFGDAEIASLIAPRSLVIEHSRGPELTRHTVNTGPGKLTTPSIRDVRREFGRIGEFGLDRRVLINSGSGEPIGLFGTRPILKKLALMIGVESEMALSDKIPTDMRDDFDPSQRQQRLVKQLENHTMLLLRNSEYARDETILKPLPTKSLDEFQSQAKKLRQKLRYEHIGWLDELLLKDLNVRTRKLYDAPKWTGYHVAIDVWPDVFAWGILCLPKGIKPDERRPVVVCQHGLEGLPQDTIEQNVSGYQYYKSFAARLAEQGYVTFAPHNLYRGSTEFRLMQRKLNPLKASLYSVITPQHSQIINWLETLPFVDKDRIGFYGLSYGGKTAMRVPALETRYAMSICSADFNEWVRINADVHVGNAYMYRGPEWEMVEWNLGHSFNYAEMSYLIAPRPFMVERGRGDGVGTDEWVAYEFARSKRLYEKLSLGDRCVIEYFNGPHTINLVGTDEFLRKHLQWPKGKR